MTKVANTHLALDRATSGYADLGTWTYSYDSASSPLDETQTRAMDWRYNAADEEGMAHEAVKGNEE